MKKQKSYRSWNRGMLYICSTPISSLYCNRGIFFFYKCSPIRVFLFPKCFPRILLISSAMSNIYYTQVTFFTWSQICCCYDEIFKIILDFLAKYIASIVGKYIYISVCVHIYIYIVSLVGVSFSFFVAVLFVKCYAL